MSPSRSRQGWLRRANVNRLGALFDEALVWIRDEAIGALHNFKNRGTGNSGLKNPNNLQLPTTGFNRDIESRVKEALGSLMSLLASCSSAEIPRLCGE